MLYLVEADLWPEDLQRLLATALSGFSHTITRVDEVGEVVKDCNGYPWKKIAYRYESDVANLPLGAPVYGEYM